MNTEVQSKKRPLDLSEQTLTEDVAPKRSRFQNVESEVIDLSDDDDDDGSDDDNSDGSYKPPSPNRSPHTPNPKAHVLLPPKSTPKTVVTPVKSTPIKSALHNIPELADRYILKASTAEDVSYTDPRKFGVRPAYWERWTGKTYGLFAEYLREHIDLVPFAKKIERPVEEVKHVFDALVVNPLHDASEAQRRGGEGMEEIFELFGKWGTPSRVWGRGVPRVKGQLDCVGAGEVRVVLEDGLKKMLELGSLSGEDVKYLKRTLTKEDVRVLWEEGSMGLEE